MDTSTSPLLLTIIDGLAEIRFNRPKQLNALNVDMAHAFQDAIATVVSHTDMRAILVTGAGTAFMAGGDLAHFRDSPSRQDAARELIEPIHAGILMMVESRIPTIAAIQGAAAGAGMSIALLTDLAVAAENARFTNAYIKIAASPDCGGSWALERLVGHRKAAEIALLSDPIDAAEAWRLGLVNRVVPTEQLHSTAVELARRIADGPADAMRQTRMLLDAAPRASLEEQLRSELDSFVTASSHADFDEGIRAFFARRPACFRPE